jgi:hypothetical protein
VTRRGIAADQHTHHVADIAHSFVGRGELFHHLLHESRELGHAFLRLGYGLHHGADGVVRRQSRDGGLHRVDDLGLHRAQVGCGGRHARVVVMCLFHL